MEEGEEILSKRLVKVQLTFPLLAFCLTKVGGYHQVLRVTEDKKLLGAREAEKICRGLIFSLCKMLQYRTLSFLRVK